MTDIVFDKGAIAQLTAAEMHEFFQANRKIDMQKQAEIIARVVKDCPEEWGNPNVADTYVNLPFKKAFRPVVRAFSELAIDADVSEIPELTFDLDAILAKDMGDFFQAVNISDLKRVSAVLARVAVTVPSKWGAANDPETYLKRPYSQFLGIANRFIREVNEDSKN